MKYTLIGVNCSINLFLLLYFYRSGNFHNADWKQVLQLMAFVITANLINFALYRRLKPDFTFFEFLISVITIFLVWVILFFVYIFLVFVTFFSSSDGSLFQN